MEKVSATGDVQFMVNELRSEHAALEAKLQELEHHVSLTNDEQFEILRLKKLKLAAKDRIMQLSKRGNA